MTKDEMQALAVGDRLVRTRDDGVEETGTVTDRTQTLLYVEWPSGQEGVVEIKDSEWIRLEKSNG